jgi:hypothetical protein
LGDGTIGREELLGVSRRLEPLHAPLPLEGGLMRVLRAIIEIPSLAMLHPRQNLLLRRTIAFERHCQVNGSGGKIGWLSGT